MLLLPGRRCLRGSADNGRVLHWVRLLNFILIYAILYFFFSDSIYLSLNTQSAVWSSKLSTRLASRLSKPFKSLIQGQLLGELIQRDACSISNNIPEWMVLTHDMLVDGSHIAGTLAQMCRVIEAGYEASIAIILEIEMSLVADVQEKGMRLVHFELDKISSATLFVTSAFNIEIHYLRVMRDPGSLLWRKLICGVQSECIDDPGRLLFRTGISLAKLVAFS